MAEEARNVASASELEPVHSISEEEETAAPARAPEESKALVVVENADKPVVTDGSHERDAFLTRVAAEKRMSMIKAWEENEKAKAENRAARRLAGITSWENSKIAQMEAELKKIQQQLEMKKAVRAEKLRNAAAAARRAAEEKRAAAVARRGEEVVGAEEAAERYRARGQAPTTTSLFGGCGGLFGRGG